MQRGIKEMWFNHNKFYRLCCGHMAFNLKNFGGQLLDQNNMKVYVV